MNNIFSIPKNCYDSINKRYKCNMCLFCVNYTIGNSGFKKFKKHYILCNNIMEKLTLQELSLKYFDKEQEINKTINKKLEICKEIDDLYDQKRDIYNEIKKKQEEKPELNRNYE